MNSSKWYNFNESVTPAKILKPLPEILQCRLVPFLFEYWILVDGGGETNPGMESSHKPKIIIDNFNSYRRYCIPLMADVIF